jgi:hypothetical protein
MGGAVGGLSALPSEADFLTMYLHPSHAAANTTSNLMNSMISLSM